MSIVEHPSRCAGSRQRPVIYPVRVGPTDSVCPNFYVLEHATGCRFAPQCAYCYLRDRTQFSFKTGVRASLDQIEQHVRAWIARDDLDAFVLNTGNLSDSLVFEDVRPTMARLVETFRDAAEIPARPHTLLLVTKGGVRHIAGLLESRPCRNVIVSFSVNSPAAAARYESGAAEPADRLQAARLLRDRGWRIRIRIDPVVPGFDYAQTIQQVRDLAPERVTLGCLRADGRLWEFVEDGLLDGLEPPRNPEGTWHHPLDVRLGLYRPAVECLRDTCSIGLCDEVPAVWDALGLATQTACCNCNHL
jgi:DNA repair photolyase